LSGFDLFIVVLIAGLAGLAIWLLRSTADWRAYLSDEDRPPSETSPDDPPPP
jgi:high-affinity Fe2+/Pb2+ permease